jgi:hypothetical protein
VNFEFSVNALYWESKRITSEVRPIVNIEAGVGVGVTAGADRLTFKLMLWRDLNPRPKN